MSYQKCIKEILELIESDDLEATVDISLKDGEHFDDPDLWLVAVSVTELDDGFTHTAFVSSASLSLLDAVTELYRDVKEAHRSFSPSAPREWML